MFEVRQLKVHIFGIPKYLQEWENVDTNEVDIYNIICNEIKCILVFLKKEHKDKFYFLFKWENVDIIQVDIYNIICKTKTPWP
jgi:hypothetical protein